LVLFFGVQEISPIKKSIPMHVPLGEIKNPGLQLTQAEIWVLQTPQLGKTEVQERERQVWVSEVPEPEQGVPEISVPWGQL
jgi:hypothetical protein